MGLNCGAQVLYSLCGLKMGDIVDICQGLTNEQEMPILTIDVDCSNACFKIGKMFNHWLGIWSSGPELVYVWSQCVMLKSNPYANKPQTNEKLKGTETRIKASIIRKDLHSLHQHAYLDASH